MLGETYCRLSSITRAFIVSLSMEQSCPVIFPTTLQTCSVHSSVMGARNVYKT